MIEFLGLCTQNLIKSFKYLLSGQLRFSEVISKAASISYDSLSISLIIAFISAAVIAIQVSKQFLMTGAEAYIGGTLVIVLIREIAPGFVALAIGARAGTAISAEIANMQVTSQVDAMKTLKVDPVGYYFTPRIITDRVNLLFYTKNYCRGNNCPNGCTACRICWNYRRNVCCAGYNKSSSCKIYVLCLGMAKYKRYLHKPFKSRDFRGINCSCVKKRYLPNQERSKTLFDIKYQINQKICD